MEKYLNMKNFSMRSSVTKLRLSNQRLAIETGRHAIPKTHREKRFCPFCPEMVEDEHHFLFECKILQHLRGDCDIPRFENLSKEFE